MNKILNNKILRAIQRGLNEAFLNLNIDDIEDIDDNSTYILKNNINNDSENQYFINKQFYEFICADDKVGLYKLIQEGKKYKVNNDTLYNTVNFVPMIREMDNLNWIDVEDVTNMHALFKDRELFNEDITEWDVSNVTDMSNMFENCKYFDQDISSWDVHNVMNMKEMFKWALTFNQDISSWDVSNVLNMNKMFAFTREFNINLDRWDVRNVSDMRDMFGCCNFMMRMPSWYNRWYRTHDVQ